MPISRSMFFILRVHWSSFTRFTVQIIYFAQDLCKVSEPALQIKAITAPLPFPLSQLSSKWLLKKTRKIGLYALMVRAVRLT